MKSPPGRRIAAERFPGIFRVGAWTRFYVDDPHFENIARLSATDKDGSGADVDAKAFARAAPQELAIDRARSAPVHAFFVLSPEIDALRSRIALYHALGIVIGMMGKRLDGYEVA